MAVTMSSLACGGAGSEGDDDSALGDDSLLGEEATSPVGKAAWVDSLSAADAELVTSYLERTGRRAPTSVDGSTLHWDDAMLSLDDIRASNARNAGALIDKGYAALGPASPGSDSGTILFERPDTQRAYFFIIADDAPDFVFDALTKVVREFTENPNDCISPNTMIVLRQSKYDAQALGVKDESFEVAVNYIPVTSPGWPCGSPNGPKACADFPGAQPLFLNGSFDFNRQALGDRLFFDSGNFPASNPVKFENEVRHEMGHAYGLEHQNNPAHVLIPGSQDCGECQTQFPSIMNPLGRASLSTDDLVSLATLYTDLDSRENDDCEYDPKARLLTATRP